MKATVLYYSKSGHTKRMAEVIADGMAQVEGMQAHAMSIEDIDEAWVQESSCVILGTPTYFTGVCEPIEHFLQNCRKYNLAGKIGGAFATADYPYGGGEVCIQNILTRMLFWGMMTYSGGGVCGAPPIHMGPVGVTSQLDEIEGTFKIYGQRMAEMTTSIFSPSPAMH